MKASPTTIDPDEIGRFSEISENLLYSLLSTTRLIFGGHQLSLFAPSDAVQSAQEEARRVLIIVDAGSSALAPALTQNGYQVTTVPLSKASWALKTETPDLVLLELYQGFVGGNT